MPYRGETCLSIKLGTQLALTSITGQWQKTQNRIKYESFENGNGKYSGILHQVC